MRLSLFLSILPLVAATPAAMKRDEPAPLLTPRGEDDLIADSYIVKFKEGSPMAKADGLFGILNSQAKKNMFKGAFRGFAGKVNRLNLQAIQNHPDVEYIEQDGKYYLDGVLSQARAPWGLGRIAHREKGNSEYLFDERAGEGTCSYIIDSGIDADHPEFEGRAKFVAKFGSGPIADDCAHGTHVAGTIGSRTYGVAKKTKIFAIKALAMDGIYCTTSMATLVQAMNFVSSDSKKQDCPNGVILNMSLGGFKSRAINDAARSLSREGIFVVAASGNKNQPASNYSPASEPEVCTVGATDINDRRYVDSNYGPLVDVNAPGVDIISTVPGGRVAAMTGTSMASPHVAGLAAYLASVTGKRAGPESCDIIRGMATKDAITNQVADTVNLLAFNGI